MSEAKEEISVASLQIFLGILVDHSRRRFDSVHISDGIRWFQDAAQDLENRLESGDLPHHLREDLQRIVEIFRSVGK